MQLQAQQWITLPERHDMSFAGLEGLITIGSTDGAALSKAFPKRGLSPLASDLYCPITST